MKQKWFLRGLGVGMILTALVLCITYRNIEENTSVIQKAKELGMVFPKNETSAVEQTAEDVLKKDTIAKEVSEAAVVGKEQVVESEKDKKAKEKVEKSKENIEKASAYHGKNRTFVVRNGLLSSSVSREMEEAGFIEDADELDKYLRDNGYERMVRSGKYKIPADADIETIAKIITRQD
nr:hypothetical protein [Eubacterium sp.]